MSYEYARRRTPSGAQPNTEAQLDRPSPELLLTGAAAPSPEQRGRRVDLPEAMRAKMEASFGADLSAVRLYESEAVEEAGANAVARGSDIAFAPGMLDFTSFGGQALLGHELSHVVSQARGEVTGGGFLNDASLEARADREGAMAAAGQTVAQPTASLSPVSAAAASGPMQADKKEEKLKKHQAREAEAYDRMVLLDKNGKNYEKDRAREEKNISRAQYWQKYWGGKDYKPGANPELTGMKQLERAKARHTDPLKTLDEPAYIADLEKVYRHMPKKQLTSKEESGFREQLVQDYSSYRGRQMAKDGGDTFQSGDIGSGGILADMYTHMMGGQNIESILTGNNEDTGVAKIADLADKSGVTDLLVRQHMSAYGVRSTPEQQRSTMQDFWNYSVMSAPRNSALARMRAGVTLSKMNAASPEDLDVPTEGAFAEAMEREDNPDAKLEDATSAAFQNHLGKRLAATEDAALQSAFPKLPGEGYSSAEMAASIGLIQKDLGTEISRASESASVSDGNRFSFLRGGKYGDGTGRGERNALLAHATQKESRSTVMKMAEDLDQLPDLSREETGRSYVFLRGPAGNKDMLRAYQSRVLELMQGYLSGLEGNADAMDALRQNSAMYAGLGDYSETNKKGLVNGQLEADHRAMNDLLLRVVSGDANTVQASRLFNPGSAKDMRFRTLNGAFTGMHNAILARQTNPNKKLTAEEEQMSAMLSAFFQKMHGQPGA